MPLIKQIIDATNEGKLGQPFTMSDLKKWVDRYNIVKDDCNKYAESSIDAIPSNSDRKNSHTTNNTKPLQSSIDTNSKKEYWL